MTAIESCIEKIEQCRDPVARESARDLVIELLQMHGQAFAVILDALSSAGLQSLVVELGANPVVGPLLNLYGLHPIPFQDRIDAALDRARSRLLSHGGNVRVVEIRGHDVRLALEGNCRGCPSSQLTLRTTVEQALIEFAPDIAQLEIV